jgi:glycosyltransferase involved in cell wall biosynthesis
MKNISVLTVVYNEEDRIENFIKCFSWSDDLIIIDKSSTDNTETIIKKYVSTNIHYIKIPYTESALIAWQEAGKIIKNDWIMLLTASDLVDPELVDLVYKTIYSDNFKFGEVVVPLKMYVFGICDRHSPWCSNYSTLVYKKDQVIISDKVHEERNSCGKKFIITDTSHGYLYHLTHKKLTTFYERHIRYSDLETIKYDNPYKARKETLRRIITAIKYVFIEKKIFLLGWDGMGLALAYISYWIMIYLSVWQKFNKKGEKIYSDITSNIIKKWNKKNYKLEE